MVTEIDELEAAWRARGGEGTAWPPPEYRFRACIRRGTGALHRGEFGAAAQAFAEASHVATGVDREVARGLVHVAAAGYRRRHGDERGFERQLGHAWRRLGPYGPRHGEIDVAALLAQAVA